MVKVLSVGDAREVYSRRDGSSHRVAEALVGDETGCILLTLWDDNIDAVHEGDIILIENGYISIFKGSMRLNVGRFGSISPSDAEIPDVNEDNNLSSREIGYSANFGSTRYSRRRGKRRRSR